MPHHTQRVYPDGVGRGVPNEPTGHEWGFFSSPISSSAAVLAPLISKLNRTAQRYLVLSKPLKIIIDIKYYYVIMVLLSRHDSSVPR